MRSLYFAVKLRRFGVAVSSAVGGSGAATYPAVQAFRDLLADVRSILGSGTKIGYAADWSEYFGHQPGDGSGDVFFHLDPLWVDPEIDFVGIDNYLPLSDWRDGLTHADAAEGWHGDASLTDNGAECHGARPHPPPEHQAEPALFTGAR